MVEARLVDSKSTFSIFAHLLDARILRALADMGFARPTLVQAKALPIALEGRDILARARTGSGKTAAYCMPVVQKILSAKSVGVLYSDHISSTHRLVQKSLSASDEAYQVTRAVILVPTRELSEQVTACLQRLLTYCEKEIIVMNSATGSSTHLQR